MNKARKLLIVVLMLGLFLVKTDTTNAQVQCWGGKSWSDDRVRCSSVGGVPVCEHYTVSGYEPCSWTFNCGWMYQDYIQDCEGLPNSCSVRTYIVDDMVGSTGCCISNCNGKICGESGGCGVTCSTAGFSQWSAWSCGSCNINPGGCGTVPLYQTCTRTNACGGTQTENRVCSSTCNECGPYGSQSCGNSVHLFLVVENVVHIFLLGVLGVLVVRLLLLEPEPGLAVRIVERITVRE